MFCLCLRYRNRRIGEFLKEMHLTEGRNTGFKKILDALERNGSPLPEFETDEAHDYFITRLFVREGFYDYEGQKDSMKDNVPHDVPHEKTVLEIIEMNIRENPSITRDEIAKAAGVSIKTIGRKLKEMPHIRYVGSGNNGHWEIDE